MSGLLADGLGLGEATRGYAAALAAGGCDVSQHFVRLPGRPFPHGHPGPGGVLDLPEAHADDDADFVLVGLCPPELESLRVAGSSLPTGRVNAGLWIWDVDPLPTSWSASAEYFDEIWSPSPYVTGLLRGRVTLPIRTAPPAIRPLEPSGSAATGLSGRPTIVALADVASSLERKNPAGAIEAFVSAFAPDEGPKLLVKIWNGDADPTGRARLESLAGGRDDIDIVDQWLDRGELVDLMANALCFLSLHRAEGFGLPIFEALALGAPVVATAFSGPMGLLDETVAHLVPATPAPVPQGVPAYPAGSLWAEPDVDCAAEALRSIWTDPAAARERADRGWRLIAEQLSPAAVGPGLRAHIEERLGAATVVSPGGPRRGA